MARSWPDLLLAGTVTFASSLLKAVYNPRAFVPHAASLRQAFAHCARFLTVASRRSLGRVSVPVWLFTLSVGYSVVALVGRYPTQQVDRAAGPSPTGDPFQPPPCGGGLHPVLDPVSRAYPRVGGRLPTCYSPRSLPGVTPVLPPGGPRSTCMY